MFIAIFYQNYFHALQDLINVLWHSVVSATLHTLVVHSMTMLLQTLTLDQAGLVFARGLNLGDTGEDMREVGNFKHDCKYFLLHRKYFLLQVTNVLPELNLPPRSTALILPGQVPRCCSCTTWARPAAG